MKMIPILIHVPQSLKNRLDNQREQGTTASGFIRWLLEQHFKQAPPTGRKAR